MTQRTSTPPTPANLRLRAAARLPGAAGEQGAANALAVLHELASSPSTAADALALLHELQVHQVELELQAEELRESRAELEQALQRQIERYDSLPVSCFTLDRHLVVHELNAEAAQLLGIGHEEAHGQRLDGFLAPASAHTLHELIASLAAARPEAPKALLATLQLSPKEGVACTVQAHLSADPAGDRVLLVLSAVDPAGSGRNAKP